MIWLLSAYHADSHAAWARRLQGHFPKARWRQITLPGRHFRWRIRGNPLSWLDSLPKGRPDLVLATSMVDLATLKGLHPRLAKVPSLYYFHENQFAYPRSDTQHSSVDPQMVQLYGALAAERIAFNSAYNRDSFLSGVADLLQRLPDALPYGIVERLRGKSALCPVPVEPIPAHGPKDPNLILWNHRWEYDKAPELFARAMLELDRRGLDFRLALLGPRPGRTPAALLTLREQLGQRIAVDGRLERREYTRQLTRAGIVVSTAKHEFQGLAMQEAVSTGALPLAPNALCYPEQYPEHCRYPAGNLQGLVGRLEQWLMGNRPDPFPSTHWQNEKLWEDWRDLLGLKLRLGRGTSPAPLTHYCRSVLPISKP